MPAGQYRLHVALRTLLVRLAACNVESWPRQPYPRCEMPHPGWEIGCTRLSIAIRLVVESAREGLCLKRYAAPDMALGQASARGDLP